MKNLNYNSNKEHAPVHKPLWKVALYTTISNVDNNENNSVVSQRKMVEEYMNLHPDMEFYDTYADNAYIGSFFKRPEFMRMMKDIIAGKINCVIVKDLSHFSRNYMDFEIYINDLTTKYKVRFIAINNAIDTIKDVTNKYIFVN